MVPPLNTAEPATKALAPAAANWPETSGPTPPVDRDVDRGVRRSSL